jgi:hypothetical protein
MIDDASNPSPFVKDVFPKKASSVVVAAAEVAG